MTTGSGGTASPALRGFISDLAENPQKVADLKSDPHGTLASAGLSDDEKSLVLSGDSDAIKKALGGSNGDTVVVVIVVI